MTTNSTPQTDDTANPVTPLEMAQNAARAVLRYAGRQESDPLQSYIQHDGAAGQQAAALAGNMALVSIAETLAALVELLQQEVTPNAR